MYCKNKGLMIYQFGENLITKQKHIHLSKVAAAAAKLLQS